MAWVRAVGHEENAANGAATLERRMLRLMREQENARMMEAAEALEAAAAAEALEVGDGDGNGATTATAAAGGGAASGAAELRAAMRAAAVAQEVGRREAGRTLRGVPLGDGAWLLAKLPWLPGERTEVDESACLCASSAVDAALQLAATAFLVVAVPATAVFALLALLLLPSLAAYPIVQPVLLAARGHPLPPLATTLSACYLACLVGLAALAPAVRRFQAVRGDLPRRAASRPPFTVRPSSLSSARCGGGARGARPSARSAAAWRRRSCASATTARSAGKIEKGARRRARLRPLVPPRLASRSGSASRARAPTAASPPMLRVALDEAAQQEEPRARMQRELRQREMRALEMAAEGVEGY